MPALLPPKFDLFTHPHLLLTSSLGLLLEKVFSKCLNIPLRPKCAVPIITSLTAFLLSSSSLNVCSLHLLSFISLLFLFISKNCFWNEHFNCSKYLLLGGRNWGSERLSNLPEVTQPHISVWVTLPLVPCSHGQVRGDEPEHGICFIQDGARVLVWGPTIKARWIINLCILKESETHTHTAKGRNLRD